MGAPYWTAEEEDYFVKVILPQSKHATGTYNPDQGREFGELAPIMQAELDQSGASRRKYTQDNLFQHWYQRHSPRAKTRHELAAEQPLTRATTPGGRVGRSGNESTPSALWQNFATPPLPSSLRQMGPHAPSQSHAIYVERSTQTKITITPHEETDIRTATPRTKYQAYIEDVEDEELLPKSNIIEEQLTEKNSKSSLAPSPKSTYTAQSPGCENPQLSKDSNGKTKKRVINPKSSAGPTPKRQRQQPSTGSSPWLKTTIEDYQVEPSPGRHLSPARQHTLQGVNGSGHQSDMGDYSMSDALREIFCQRQPKRDTRSRAPSYSPISSPAAGDLQNSTLNQPLDDPKHRREASTGSRPHTPVKTGFFSRRRGQLKPIRSPLLRPATAQGQDDVNVDSYMLPSGREFSLTHSPAYSFFSQNRSQKSTPGPRVGPGPSSMAATVGGPSKHGTSQGTQFKKTELKSTVNDTELSVKHTHSRKNSSTTSSWASAGFPSADCGNRARPPASPLKAGIDESAPSQVTKSTIKKTYSRKISHLGATNTATPDTNLADMSISALAKLDASRASQLSSRISKSASARSNLANASPTSTTEIHKLLPKAAGPRPETFSRTPTPGFDGLFADAPLKAKKKKAKTENDKEYLNTGKGAGNSRPRKGEN